jgi:hypothetical protein
MEPICVSRTSSEYRFVLVKFRVHYSLLIEALESIHNRKNPNTCEQHVCVHVNMFCLSHQNRSIMRVRLLPQHSETLRISEHRNLETFIFFRSGAFRHFEDFRVGHSDI